MGQDTGKKVVAGFRQAHALLVLVVVKQVLRLSVTH